MPRIVVTISRAGEADVEQHEATHVAAGEQESALDGAEAERRVGRRTAVGDLAGGGIETARHVQRDDGGAAIARARNAGAGGEYGLT
jgi:hypothetical protein